ncbi:PEX2 [Candida oxycetoniae]|uniref:PEX2 n=1 Tax=Candida oxycetoniae TaxID=497107 RepID=A0AAI9SXG5_9ASCO|nr:PEX2 [Candida oxycetoniae]KAI3404370.2 PEX2 [Candida oxycetoniae]
MNPILYPSSRVSQLDANILDSELFSLLKEQVSSIFQLHENNNSILSKLSYARNPEVFSLLLNLLIFKLTVWKSGSTYGSSLQNLKLTDFKTGKIIGFNKRGLLLGVLVATYFYKKIETALYQLEETENNSDYNSLTSRLKSFIVNNKNQVLMKIDNTLKIANLVNFTVFLVNGKYSSIVNRVLGITETPIISDLLKFNGSNVNYEFQNRQLVWNVMTEFLVFLFPLLQLGKIRKAIGKVVNKTKTLNGMEVIGESETTRYTNLPVSECAICHHNNYMASQSGNRVFATAGPVTNPCITNCGHVYCYVCIALEFNIMKSTGDNQFCLRCNSKLEWFQEFEADEKAIDVDAITIENEYSSENEEEEDEVEDRVDGDEDDASIASASSEEIQSFEPLEKITTTRVERRLSRRSEIFDSSSSTDELSDDYYSEEEEMEADEVYM